MTPPTMMVKSMYSYVIVSAIICLSATVHAKHEMAFVSSFVTTRRADSVQNTMSKNQWIHQKSTMPIHLERSSNNLNNINNKKDHRPSNKNDHNNPPKSSLPSSSHQQKSTELSASYAGAMTQPFKVFCDLDGVLVDFEAGVLRLANSRPSQLLKSTMWKHVANANSFFEHLPWTKDGRRLWNSIRHLRPDILTGVPSYKESREEKFRWCERELGLDKLHHVDMAADWWDHDCVNGNEKQKDVTNIITCWSDNKYLEGGYHAVLIDDRECMRENWEKAGGIFIHHVNTELTLRQLREHGILTDNDSTTV